MHNITNAIYRFSNKWKFHLRWAAHFKASIIKAKLFLFFFSGSAGVSGFSTSTVLVPFLSPFFSPTLWEFNKNWIIKSVANASKKIQNSVYRIIFKILSHLPELSLCRCFSKSEEFNRYSYHRVFVGTGTLRRFESIMTQFYVIVLLYFFCILLNVL